MSVVCFVETHTMTLAGIVPSVQAAASQWELAAVEGPKEPEVLDPVSAASALPTSQSKFSFHGISRQFQLLTTQHYCLRLIHQ